MTDSLPADTTASCASLPSSIPRQTHVSMLVSMFPFAPASGWLLACPLSMLCCTALGAVGMKLLCSPFAVMLPSILLRNACTVMTAYHCGGRYVQTPAYAGNEQQPRHQRLAADKARRQVSQNRLQHASPACQQRLPHMAQPLLTVHIHSIDIADSHYEMYSGIMQCRLKSLW